MPGNNLGTSTEPRPIRILALCDSPVVSSHKFVLSTGFGRVGRNILGRWHGALAPGEKHSQSPAMQVDCHAINFDGWGYERSPFQLFPAGGPWNSPANLKRFLELLETGGYTHLWMLMDVNALSLAPGNFAGEIKRICREQKIRSMLYYPLDAVPEREWLAILDAVDVAVTYTQWARDVTRQVLGKSLYPIEVIAHGVDEVFRPMVESHRESYRKMEIQLPKNQSIDFFKPGDFLMLMVAKNEWRKDPLRALEIVKDLRERGIPAKLVLRMAPYSLMGGIQLDLAARQLGLTYGLEWCHISDIRDEDLCGLYNAVDLFLTTSMGEGWGLPVTEALACGLPVALAKHTSFSEIGALPGVNPIWLPLEDNFVCGADTRLRRRVDLNGAVDAIQSAYDLNADNEFGIERVKPDLSSLSWDTIAQNMLDLLLGTPKETRQSGSSALSVIA